MLIFFVISQTVLAVFLVMLVLMQNSSTDPISSFTSNNYSVNNTMNIKPAKNPLAKITWIISMLFFINTMILGKVMSYKEKSLIVDSVTQEVVQAESNKSINIPFNED